MNPVKIHPIRSESIILWGDDRNEEHILVKGKNCEGSIISFDKRQTWTVYPYKRYSNDTRYCGACERNGVYIRLMPKDFCRIFGTKPFDAQAEQYAPDINDGKKEAGMSDLISRQATIVVIKCSGLDDDSKDTVVRVLEQLPSAQPERTCVNCGRTVNNGGWYADGGTRCPIEEHYALPKDGYCHLWEKRNVTDDDYPERRTDE